MVDAVLVCSHDNPHPIKDVQVYCPVCRRLVLIRTDPADLNVRVVQIMVLAVATLGAGLLFRVTNQVWPAYLYLGLALTFMYAVVFSRGRRTLSVAAGGLGLVTLGWLGWWLIGPELHPSGVASAVLQTLPAAVWFLSLAGVLLMRHWSIPATKEPGTYLLAVGVFTLGFWGVWATLLQGGLVTTFVYQAAVVLGFLAPLLFIPLIRKWGPYQDNKGSLIVWCAIVAAYLMVADLVVRVLGYILGQIFPHILGLPALTPVRLQLSYPQARAGLTVATLGIILLIALTQSIVQVASQFSKPEQVDAGSTTTTTGGHPTGLALFERADDAAAEEGVFVVKVADDFLSKFRGFAKLINLIIPVLIFTALSILFILMLDVFREYDIYGTFADPTAIWGMTILTMFLSLAGFAVAAYFSPWAYKEKSEREATAPNSGQSAEPARTVRGRNWPSLVNGSAVLLSGFYVFVSVASLLQLAVWLALWTSDQSRRSFTPGPIYLINLGFVGTVVGTLLVLGVVIDGRRRRSAAGGDKRSAGTVVRSRVAAVARYVLPPALALLAISAMVFGARPMIQAVSFVVRSHDAAADRLLRSVVPPDVLDKCSQDHLILARSRADLSCVLSDHAGVVSYHLFANGDEMNRVYVAILSGRGVDVNRGGCDLVNDATAVPASERLGCYTVGGTAWIAWTDDGSNVLSLFYRSDGDLVRLYEYWRTGSLNPVPPAQ